MTVYLKDLFENPQIFGDLARERCAICNVALQETLTGKRPTPTGPACSDCYYEKLGEELEKHPVGEGAAGEV